MQYIYKQFKYINEYVSKVKNIKISTEIQFLLYVSIILSIIHKMIQIVRLL